MSYLIAAAGTGGHVYPGLAVGEALVDRGISRSEILYVGGSRLESTVYPEAGFPFLEVELRGLQRRLTASNLGIHRVVRAAMARIHQEIETQGVRVVLGMGGYVTVPAWLAARRTGASLMLSEQNAEAGLANRLAARSADRVFVSFPSTRGLPGGEWVGNPLRRAIAGLDREELRATALGRYGLEEATPVLGVVGGSLGAGVLNQAVSSMLSSWTGPDLQVLHLAGRSGAESLADRVKTTNHRWVLLDYEPEMQYFFAAVDLVVSRAGGAVAELTATRTPSVLVPGHFGSGSHQEANAEALAAAGAAVIVTEEHVDELGSVVSGLLMDPGALESMRSSCDALAHPHAADVIAAAMETAHG